MLLANIELITTSAVIVDDVIDWIWRDRIESVLSLTPWHVAGQRHPDRKGTNRITRHARKARLWSFPIACCE